MPPDATILTLRDRLPIEYVRRILALLYACKAIHGDARLVIRVDGNGTTPDYRIETEMDRETGQGMTVDARSGTTHRPLGMARENAACWSTERTSLEEVGMLIRNLRVACKGGRRATATSC